MLSDDLEFHEYAALFPMMGPSEHEALTADIKAHGLIHPIITLGGKILDGRNRFLACRAAGVEPRLEALPDDVDALAYCVSTNFARRHLSESQRALAAARIEEHKVSREQAMAMFKIKKSSLKQAEMVLKNGISELIDCVSEDRMPVHIGAKVSGMPEDAQQEACLLNAKDLRGIVKSQARLKRTASLAKATKIATEKLGTKLYPVIYADPPWKFETWSENGMDRSPENHYPTETTETIAAMQIPATENAVLFLWATGPMIQDALQVMKAWGFEYRSQFVWVKDKAATGYWNRGRHELLLVGVRGNMPAPDPSDRVDSVIDEPAGEHSAKPPAVRKIIEEMYPTLPKLELFARRYHAGWDSHGNELPAPETSQDELVGAQA